MPNEDPPANDQAATLAFLQAMASAPGAALQTHISWIVLGHDRAWKLKKAVRLPYLDFASPERRLAACAAELRLNRRTAPALYLGVHRITRASGGTLELDGTGDLVDAAVEMRRFPDDALFDTLAARGALSTPLLTTLAETIASFHATAEPVSNANALASMDAALAANEQGFHGQKVLALAGYAPLLAAMRARADVLASRLAGRSARVRHCHGDLHLRNICLVEGTPTLFDCIEFNDDLARIDVLYDLAFLLMDLWHRGLAAEANLVMNRYLDRTGDEAEAALLTFYMAVRAAVRAHVGATQAGDDATGVLAASAQSYLALAGTLLAEPRRRLVAVGGLSGSGKSTVAAALAPQVGAPPGARVLSTDRLRKALFGKGPLERLPESAYAPDVSTQVYALQRARAGTILAGGGSVVADGVFLREDERRAIAAVAEAADAAFAGLWLDAPAETLATRVAARRGDPSDATGEIVAAQTRLDPGRIAWQRVPASGSPADTCAAARHAVAIPGTQGGDP